MSHDLVEIGSQAYRDALRAFSQDRRSALLVPDRNAAEQVAKDLGLSLYRIDLAALISKYIGETEKNLERALQATEAASTLLLFDEADALFGQRSEVEDAHDRFANIEVSYLLSRAAELDSLAVFVSREPKCLREELQREVRVALRRVDHPRR